MNRGIAGLRGYQEGGDILSEIGGWLQNKTNVPVTRRDFLRKLAGGLAATQMDPSNVLARLPAQEAGTGLRTSGSFASYFQRLLDRAMEGGVYDESNISEFNDLVREWYDSAPAKAIRESELAKLFPDVPAHQRPQISFGQGIRLMEQSGLYPPDDPTAFSSIDEYMEAVEQAQRAFKEFFDDPYEEGIRSDAADNYFDGTFGKPSTAHLLKRRILSGLHGVPGTEKGLASLGARDLAPLGPDQYKPTDLGFSSRTGLLPETFQYGTHGTAGDDLNTLLRHSTSVEAPYSMGKSHGPHVLHWDLYDDDASSYRTRALMDRIKKVRELRMAKPFLTRAMELTDRIERPFGLHEDRLQAHKLYIKQAQVDLDVALQSGDIEAQGKARKVLDRRIENLRNDHHIFENERNRVLEGVEREKRGPLDRTSHRYWGEDLPLSDQMMDRAERGGPPIDAMDRSMMRHMPSMGTPGMGRGISALALAALAKAAIPGEVAAEMALNPTEMGSGVPYWMEEGYRTPEERQEFADRLLASGEGEDVLPLTSGRYVPPVVPGARSTWIPNDLEAIEQLQEDAARFMAGRKRAFQPVRPQ